MHHQCIGLRISQLQRIDDLCINAFINARLEIRNPRFNFHQFVVSRFAGGYLDGWNLWCHDLPGVSRWLEFGDAGDIDYLCLVNQ